MVLQRRGAGSTAGAIRIFTRRYVYVYVYVYVDVDVDVNVDTVPRRHRVTGAR